MRDGRPTLGISTFSWSPESTFEHFGGDEKLARELIALFISDCPRLLANLRTRLNDQDLVAGARAAHALKGSIGNFTSDGPAQTAHELERLCGVGRHEAAVAMFERLEQELQQLVATMQAFQAGAPRCES